MTSLQFHLLYTGSVVHQANVALQNACETEPQCVSAIKYAYGNANIANTKEATSGHRTYGSSIQESQLKAPAAFSMPQTAVQIQSNTKDIQTKDSISIKNQVWQHRK